MSRILLVTNQVATRGLNANNSGRVQIESESFKFYNFL